MSKLTLMSDQPLTKPSKRDRIFAEAAKLFQEKGYPSSSMRELANRVGIEASSLYSHIASKAEILEKICFDTASLYIDHWKSMDNDALRPIEKLEQLIDFHVEMAIENPIAVTVFNDEWKHLSSEKRNTFQELRHSYEDHIKECISEGIQCGYLRDIDPQILCFTILNGLRWLYFQKDKSRSWEEDAKETLKGIFINGISAN